MTDTSAGWTRRESSYVAAPPQWGYQRPLPVMPSHVHLTHPRMPNFPFLSLAALDNLPLAHQNWGVCYSFIMDACYVLCKTENPNQTGYLSLDPAGVQPVPESPLLAAGSYYWHVGSPTEHECACNWKIVNDFNKWEFPAQSEFTEAGALAHWSVHTLSGAIVTRDDEAFRTQILARDMRCILTGGEFACQASHLIPVNNADWFTSHRMSRFALSDAPGRAIYDSSNGLLLKPDMHRALDTHKLVFYPKDRSFMSHFLDALGMEIQLYHNVPVNIGKDISPHFIFGRFAFNIISRTQTACDLYANHEEWHVLMLTEPKPLSSSGSKRTSSIAGLQSSASGSKQAKPTPSAGNNQALQTVNKAAILSRVISASTWKETSAASWPSDTSHERTSSASSQDWQGVQSIVPAEIYDSAIREIKKSTAPKEVKLKALRSLGILFLPSFMQESGAISID